MPGDEKPKTHPLFRYLAVAIAIFCFVLAGVFGWVQMDVRRVSAVICLLVGFIMATIAVTGYGLENVEAVHVAYDRPRILKN